MNAFCDPAENTPPVPLGFYMSAQGSLIIYVVIIWIYARYMQGLDRQYNVDEGDTQ